MKRKRIVGIIVLMLSLAVFCLAACQPQTREVEAVEPEPTTLAQSGSTERDPGFSPRPTIRRTLSMLGIAVAGLATATICTRSFQGIGSICPTQIWQPMGRGRRSPTA